MSRTIGICAVHGCKGVPLPVEIHLRLLLLVCMRQSCKKDSTGHVDNVLVQDQNDVQQEPCLVDPSKVYLPLQIKLSLSKNFVKA